MQVHCGDKFVQEDSTKSAGFWARCTAGLIDITGIAVIVVVTAEVLAVFGMYIPIELSVIIAYVTYTAVSIAWRGQALGGWLCGHKVMRWGGLKVGPIRSTVRAFAVAVSQCLLGFPFLVVAIRRSKCGLHDILAGTKVVVLDHGRNRRRWTAAIVWLVVAGWFAVQTVSGWRLYRVYSAWCADADAAAEEQGAPTASPIEVSSLDDAQHQAMIAWLADHSQTPADCVVGVAARHQVTILGEVHGKKEVLAFLNRIIPRLYREAGVRAIALECCPSDLDDEIARLINGQLFDRELARHVARSNVWAAWGWQGYWDVLETVWELNRSLSADQEPLQVVGISPRLDLPSLDLVKRGPWAEKLRIVRLLDDLPKLFFHDGHYACHVERPAFRKGKRTVVLVGEAHSILCSTRPGTHRMGSMLHGRYDDQVTHVVFHNEYIHGKIQELIEECAEQRSGRGFAFEVTDSPFAALRDGSAYFYSQQPKRRFADLVSAYVVLAPAHSLERCDWMDGYVSRYMFGRNKPMYELMVGRQLVDHREANRYMAKGIQF